MTTSIPSSIAENRMARSVLSGRRTSFPSSTSALSSSSPSSSSQAWKGSFSCLAVWTYGGLSRDSVGVGVGEEAIVNYKEELSA